MSYISGRNPGRVALEKIGHRAAGEDGWRPAARVPGIGGGGGGVWGITVLLIVALKRQAWVRILVMYQCFFELILRHEAEAGILQHPSPDSSVWIYLLRWGPMNTLVKSGYFQELEYFCQPPIYMLMCTLLILFPHISASLRFQRCVERPRNVHERKWSSDCCH